MVIYEVNLSIQREIQGEFLPWLEAHIQEMLTFSGFVSAELFQVEEDPLQLCVCYRLESLSALNNYLQKEAPRMRQVGLQRFADKMQVHRRIMLRKAVF